MSRTPNTSRGYRAISEMVARFQRIVDVLNRANLTSLTLSRADLDLIQRWPDAAASQNIFTIKGVSYWRGIELRAEDVKWVTQHD